MTGGPDPAQVREITPALVAELDSAIAGLVEDRECWRRRFEDELARAEHLHRAHVLAADDALRRLEQATAAEQERARLAALLREVRAAIDSDLNNCSIIDTVWISDTETVVDAIDAALSRSGEPQT